MERAAIYARYSTSEQRPTSIEDQVRRAREKAANLGYEVPDELVFSDAIITGAAKGLSKRLGYDKLMRSWDRKEFSAVFVDEISRLAREPVALANLQVRIEKTRVRLVSTDGLDSSVAGWQLQFGFCGVIASHFLRETGHRVVRGMIGQLERGFMIAAPPFGYRPDRVEEVGTNWLIDEKSAIHVRNVFDMRKKGASLSSIAKTLNELGVTTPRKSKNGGTQYWRPGTIHQMLKNPIYRGVFIWNDSPFSKAKEKRGETILEAAEYPRPHLRLVDDDTWFRCNVQGNGCIVRGGDKNIFAGLVSCGTCDAKLTVASGGSSPSLYCAQCAQARAVGVADRAGKYTSGSGLQAVLVRAIESVFSGDAETMFRKRLKARLEGGQEARIAEVRKRLAKIDGKVKLFARLLASSETDDPSLEQQYRQIVAEKRQLATELASLETAWSTMDTTAIERQLEVNPRHLLPHLFSGAVPAAETRAALRRLFPRIVFHGKPERFSSLFTVELAQGATVAEVSDTPVIDTEMMTKRFKVTGGAKRPSTWAVEEM